MYGSKVTVRLDEECAAAVAAMELRGLKQSEAIRLLLRLGHARTGELPDAFYLGLTAGREQGRREVIAAGTAAVSKAMYELNEGET
jgi:antitoxin component of RelBE/YafQ-DinJ toxin-antitoxin module